MTTIRLPYPTDPQPLRLFAAGWIAMAAFGALLLWVGAGDRGFATRLAWFVGLILPPVCFAAGIWAALRPGARRGGTGLWLNLAALVVHGALMLIALQRFLG